MHDLTAKNAASSQDAMDGTYSVDYPCIGRENKREELGKKKPQPNKTQSNIYRGPLHFNHKQSFRSAGIFQLC